MAIKERQDATGRQKQGVLWSVGHQAAASVAGSTGAGCCEHRLPTTCQAVRVLCCWHHGHAGGHAALCAWSAVGPQASSLGNVERRGQELEVQAWRPRPRRAGKGCGPATSSRHLQIPSTCRLWNKGFSVIFSSKSHSSSSRRHGFTPVLKTSEPSLLKC